MVEEIFDHPSNGELNVISWLSALSYLDQCNTTLCTVINHVSVCYHSFYRSSLLPCWSTHSSWSSGTHATTQCRLFTSSVAMPFSSISSSLTFTNKPTFRNRWVELDHISDTYSFVSALHILETSLKLDLSRDLS